MASPMPEVEPVTRATGDEDRMMNKVVAVLAPAPSTARGPPGPGCGMHLPLPVRGEGRIQSALNNPIFKRLRTDERP